MSSGDSTSRTLQILNSVQVTLAFHPQSGLARQRDLKAQAPLPIVIRLQNHIYSPTLTTSIHALITNDYKRCRTY